MIGAEKVDVLYPYTTGTAEVMDEHDGNGVWRRVQTSHCPNEIVTTSGEERIKALIHFPQQSLPNVHVFTVVFVL